MYCSLWPIGDFAGRWLVVSGSLHSRFHTLAINWQVVDLGLVVGADRLPNLFFNFGTCYFVSWRKIGKMQEEPQFKTGIAQRNLNPLLAAFLYRPNQVLDVPGFVP